MAARDSDVFAIIEAIRKAWYEGRRIVPIVGAGLSVDSGIPTIQSLIRYFCKFHQYLAKGAFLPTGSQLDSWLGHPVEDLRTKPWEYVKQFEWPDRFELTQNLQHRLEGDATADADQAHGLMEQSIREALDDILVRTNPEGHERYAEVRRILTEYQRGDEGYREFRLLGDWKKVVQHFTNHQGDYADALFQRLTFRRGPSAGHRFLAFLVRLLAIRQVFTFNFDDLIERALAAEGIDHQVFPMEHGSELPFEGLVRDLTTVIKMHGGNRSLLLDERLDHPLGAEYKRRFRAMTGEQALLLVIGCSGGDRRLRDLLEWSVGQPGSGTTVAWLHFEKETPGHLTSLKAMTQGGSRVLSAATASPGLTLQHVFSALAGRHPSSTRPYAAHITRPLPLGSATEHGDAHFGRTDETTASRRIVLSTLSANLRGTHYLDGTASEALLDWAAHWVRNGYQTVWVDLEASHTLAAVVGSIIDQCRQLDPVLAPGVLPLDDNDEAVETAVRRVREALRRSRYVVLLDGVEAYLWPPTVHHGESHFISPNDPDRIAKLKRFLLLLGEQSLGGSKLMVGVDESKVRSDKSGDGMRTLDKYVELAGELGVRGWKLVPLPRTKTPYKATFEMDNDRAYADLNADARVRLQAEVGLARPGPTWPLLLHALTTVRRARHLAFARQLLRPLVGGGESFEAVITAMTDPSEAGMGRRLGMVRLEGGGVWFQRAVRDAVYEFNSRLTSRDKLKELLAGASPDVGEYRGAATQAFLLAAVHQWVARVYYSHTFVQAHDATAFMEYLYHRLSSIKYLTKLLALMHRARRAGEAGLRQAVVEGFADFAEVARASVPAARLDELAAELVTDEDLAKYLKGPGEDVDFADLEKAFGKRHRRDIRNLARAWSRAEPQLRSQVPAGQILSWTDLVMQDDIPHRLDNVVLDYHKATGAAVPYDAGGVFLADAQPHVRELRRTLANTRVKLHLERSDYAMVARERRRMFDGPASGDTAGRAADFVKIGKRLLRRVRVHAKGGDPGEAAPPLCEIHYLLDVAVALIKRGQESPGTSPEGSPEERARLGELLDIVERVLKALQALFREDRGTADDRWKAYIAALEDADERAGAEGDYNEAWLRLHHLRAELDLGDVSVFASSRGFEEALKFALEKLDAAVGNVRQGLYKVRGQAQRSDGRFRSLILEPSVDGSIYLPYRSAFLVLDARTKWLAVARGLGSARLGHAAVGEFESAYYSLDLSRGGLTPGNRLVAALTELYAVETSLACARLLLRPDPTATPDDIDDAMQAAFAKFETVRLCLQRAREHLLSGRRNVIWWKLFYLLVAQYHADRSTLGLLRWTNARDHESLSKRFLPTQFVVRLRRGHQAIRSALDYQLPSAGPRASGPWLQRVWAEMSLTAAVVGTRFFDHQAELKWRKEIKAEGVVPQFEPPDCSEQVRALIRHINVTARLTPDGDPRPVATMAAWIDDAGSTGLMAQAADLIRSMPRNFQGPSRFVANPAAENALDFRLRVLHAAQKWVEGSALRAATP